MSIEVQASKNNATFLVDSDDFEKIKNHSWTWCGRYLRTQIDRRKFLLHRFILGLTDPLVHVDHKNGNTLDNRRENLRTCTKNENNANKKVRKDNRTGFKGVEINHNRFTARISHNKKRIYLGTFGSPVEAAKAYDRAAIGFYGEFAKLNFPQLHSESIERSA